ncbi:uncharacterized protein F4817DRAFT_21572 [Daldinia loculata]|uniref:uncharacterized protein n=1 Tax=Daldinia loculata TaxID=103429 RepID=UPI0020C54BE3|nr:uncharacterized protein F4817DRAFT_21572 [Daldinia loculata]KAI1641965.1 hypothetical protein F4817DRAFT_21572 [Daldinia loculata]
MKSTTGPRSRYYYLLNPSRLPGTCSHSVAYYLDALSRTRGLRVEVHYSLHTVALDKFADKVDVVLPRSGSRLNPHTTRSRAFPIDSQTCLPPASWPRHRRFI